MALPLLKDAKIISRVIEMILEFYTKKNTSVDLLYYLFKDESSIARKVKPTTKIKELIGEKIRLLSEDPVLWFILGNLKEILTKKEIIAIEQIFPTIVFEKIENTRVWKIIYYFIKDNPKLIDIYKKELLQSKTIFKSGFNLDEKGKIKSLSSGEHFSSIRHLTIEDSIWTEDELKLLFERLIDEIKLIKDWNKKDRETKFDFIYEEMIDFLDFEKSRFENINEFESTYKFVKSELIKERGYKTIKDGFLSKDKNIVLKSLAEFSLKLYDKSLKKEELNNLKLLLNRLLFDNNFYIEVVLNYLAVWTKEEKIKIYFDNFNDLIYLILEKYTNNIPENCDKPFVLKQLITISEYYESKIELENEVIDFYKKIKKENNYQFSL